MSALSIQPTFPIFTETDGLPLENGYIWIGTTNLDPQGNPINVYWDAALTIPAAQPIRTLNGYPSRSGTPGRLYVNASQYSIRVQNKNGSLVYSSPDATERYSAELISFVGFKGQIGNVQNLADNDGSDWIGFEPAGASAVARSVQEKMREIVSVFDFGAKGDWTGSTGSDDTAAIQAAIDYVENTYDPAVYGVRSPADGSCSLFFPAGNYKVTSALVVTKKVAFVGDGESEFASGSRICQVTDNEDLFRIEPIPQGMSFSFEKLTLNSIGAGSGHLVNVTKTSANCNSQRYIDCTFATPQAQSIRIQAGDDIKITGCLFDASSGYSIALGTNTAADVVSNCIISGCSFYSIPLKCMVLSNIDGLIVSGNTFYPSTNLGIIFDALNTFPYQFKNVVIANNNFKNADCILLASAPEQLNINGNTSSDLGAGAGSTLSAIEFNGAPKNISITGNVFSGSFDTKSFYDDSACSSVIANTNISGNLFTSTAGTGPALLCANSIGLIAGNTFAGFATPSVSESVATTGSTFTPGTIASLGSYTQNISATSARQGDIITIASPFTVWPLPVGIQVVAYVSAPSTITFKYENVTAGSIVVTAHDWIYTVSRSL